MLHTSKRFNRPDLSIRWRHSRVHCDIGSEIYPKGGTTICSINYVAEAEGGVVVFETFSSGHSVCSEHDTYCKAEGRMRSLAKALAAIPVGQSYGCLTKAIKAGIIKQYIATHKAAPKGCTYTEKKMYADALKDKAADIVEVYHRR